MQRSLFMLHFKHNLRWFNGITNDTKDVSSKEDCFIGTWLGTSIDGCNSNSQEEKQCMKKEFLTQK